MEAVAFVRLKQFKVDRNGIPVSRLVIFRKVHSHWTVVLDAAKGIRNPVGYVGSDYIDDSYGYPGYRVSFSDRRSDDKPAFVLWLYFLGTDGEPEGIAAEISWNPAVGRFQEFGGGDQPPLRFLPELKNPPHIRSSRNKSP